MNRRLLTAGTILTLLCALGTLYFSLRATADPPTTTYTYNVTFESTGQSAWGPGSGATTVPGTDIRYYLLGGAWNESGSTGDFWGYKGWDFGGSVDAGTVGDLGLSTHYYDIGPSSLNVRYPARVSLTAPSPSSYLGPGDTVSIASSWTPQPGWQLSATTFDGNADLDASYLLKAWASGEVCVFDCADYNLMVPAVDIPKTTKQLAHAEDTEWGDTDWYYSAVAGVDGELRVPSSNLSTSLAGDGSLVARGSDQKFLGISLDGDKWLYYVTGVKLGFQSPEYKGVQVGYDILDWKGWAEGFQSQTLTFKPSPQVTLQFPEPVQYTKKNPAGVASGSGIAQRVSFPAGWSLDYVVPLRPATNFVVTPSLSMPNSFSNLNYHTFKPTYTIAGLRVSFSIPGFTIIPGWCTDHCYYHCHDCEWKSYYGVPYYSCDCHWHGCCVPDVRCPDIGVNIGPLFSESVEVPIEVRQDYPFGGRQTAWPLPGTTAVSGPQNLVFTTDSTPAIATAEIIPEPNDLDWNNTDATLRITAWDPGAGVRAICGSSCGDIPDCQGLWCVFRESEFATVITEDGVVKIIIERDYTTEGQHLLDYNTMDYVGNFGPTKRVWTNIDESSPIITGSRTPAANANGWNNSNVLVHFDATDRVSGVISRTPDKLLSTEGANQVVTGTATDRADNSASTTVSGISIDKTPPTLTAARAPFANSQGWNNSPVTVSFIVSDTLSGLASVPPPGAVMGTEGANQSVSGAATDRAGNSASLTVGNINIDTTPPTLTMGTPNPSPNAAGWNNTDVKVRFEASDNLSGIRGDSFFDVSFVSEGANQSGESTFTDKAGNSTTRSVSGINIDWTPPQVTASRNPLPNANGWNNSDVTVRFEATDGLSGVQGDSFFDVFFSIEAEGQSASRIFTDTAGNWATATVDNVNIDKTAPTITASRTPAANAAGWNNGDVTISFTCADSLSGVDTCPDPVTLSADGAGQSVTGAVVDKAGNSASVTVDNINIDKTAPVIQITSPLAGSYLTSQSLVIAYAVSDPLSGIATQAAVLDGGSVNNGQTLNLAAMAGGHIFTVSATDEAGNSSSQSVSFPVAIAATVDLDPDTLNTKSQSDKNAVTGYIEFPTGYGVAAIDLAMLKLKVNGAEVLAQPSPTSVGDYDRDSIADRMAKFTRQAVITALGDSSGNVTIEVSGQLTDGRSFVGSDVVRVIKP